MTDKAILIWGAGAIGGTVGAFLTRAGREVTFVDVVADHVVAIRDSSRGLHITGPIDDFTITAPAYTPDALNGTWARIFLAVKAQDTEAACQALLAHLTDDGYVLWKLCKTHPYQLPGCDNAVITFHCLRCHAPTFFERNRF